MMHNTLKWTIALMGVCLFSNAWAAPQLKLGAARVGTYTPWVSLPLSVVGNTDNVAAASIDIAYNANAVTAATVISAVPGVDVRARVVGTSTLRLIVIPPANNAALPAGTIAYVGFLIANNTLIQHQTLTLQNLELTNATGQFVSGATVLNGFLADGAITHTDADGDGITDVLEAQNGLHPLDPFDALADWDGDGLNNRDEIAFGSQLKVADTDGDGMNDLTEWRYGFNPNSNDAQADADGDTITNLAELQLGTDPTKADTDGDGYTDQQELAMGRNPLLHEEKVRAALVPIIEYLLSDDVP